MLEFWLGRMLEFRVGFCFCARDEGVRDGDEGGRDGDVGVRDEGVEGGRTSGAAVLRISATVPGFGPFDVPSLRQ